MPIRRGGWRRHVQRKVPRQSSTGGKTRLGGISAWSYQDLKPVIRSSLTGSTVSMTARKLWSLRLPMKLAPLVASHLKLRAATGDKGAVAMAGGKAEIGEAARRLRKPEHLPRNKPGSPFSAA